MERHKDKQRAGLRPSMQLMDCIAKKASAPTPVGKKSRAAFALCSNPGEAGKTP